MQSPFLSFISKSTQSYLLAGLLLVTGCRVIVAATVDKEEKTFSTPTRGVLMVQVDRGSIDIVTGDTEEVRVQVKREVKQLGEEAAARVLAAHRLRMEQKGEEIIVRAEFSDESELTNREKSRLQVAYKIAIPEAFNLELKTAGGHIAVDDLAGDIQAETAGGKLSFKRIDGKVRARTAGGSIHLVQATGPVTLETSGGGMELGHLQGVTVARTSGGSIQVDKAEQPLEVRTSGGRIQIKEAHSTVKAQTAGGSISASLVAPPDEGCRLITSGGGIELTVAADLELEIEAETAAGTVETDLAFSSVQHRARSALRAQMNGGGPKVLLQTSAGNIRLKKR